MVVCQNRDEDGHKDNHTSAYFAVHNSSTSCSTSEAQVLPSTLDTPNRLPQHATRLSMHGYAYCASLCHHAAVR